jgi:hypothetical protein
MYRVATHQDGPWRGDRRLLHDLGVLRRALDEPAAPARTRLERELGTEFARVVLASLATPVAHAA